MRVKECLCATIDENECKIKYSYRLTEQDFLGVQVYGIEVEREGVISSRKVNNMIDSVEIISPDESKVRKLLSMLHNYKVSPIHLIDIIGEYVDVYVSDFKESKVAIINA